MREGVERTMKAGGASLAGSRDDSEEEGGWSGGKGAKAVDMLQKGQGSSSAGMTPGSKDWTILSSAMTVANLGVGRSRERCFEFRIALVHSRTIPISSFDLSGICTLNFYILYTSSLKDEL